MKNIFLIIIILNSLLLSQDLAVNEFFDMLYVDRQPSAKIESMGRSGVATYDEMFSVFYNPALISNINGITVSSSMTSPYYGYDDSKFSFFGIGYTLKKKLSFGLSMYNYSGDAFETTSIPFPEGRYLPAESNDYKFTISISPNRAFSFGISGKYVSSNAIDGILSEKTEEGYDMDIGIHQIVAVTRNRSFKQKTSIGISFLNAFAGDIGDYKLPRIMNTGVNFSYIPRVGSLFPNVHTVFFTFTGEYQKMWDSDYHSGMKFGSELLIIEMFALRCGYYWEKVIEEFTYGFGIYIPLYRFFGGKVPLSIKFDYANMKHPENNDLDMDYDNINSYSLSVNWLFRLED